MCFSYSLEGTALNLFLAHLYIDAPFPKIVRVILRKLNSEHRQQQFLSQIKAAKLEKLMKESKHDSLSDGLDAVVVEINRIISQHPDGIITERHKFNILREAVINYQWADITVLQAQAQKLNILNFFDSPNNC